MISRHINITKQIPTNCIKLNRLNFINAPYVYPKTSKRNVNKLASQFSFSISFSAKSTKHSDAMPWYFVCFRVLYGIVDGSRLFEAWASDSVCVLYSGYIIKALIFCQVHRAYVIYIYFKLYYATST